MKITPRSNPPKAQPTRQTDRRDLFAQQQSGARPSLEMWVVHDCERRSGEIVGAPVKSGEHQHGKQA